MKSPTLSNAHLRAAQRAFTSINGKISARLGTKWAVGPGNVFVNAVREFFAANSPALGDRPFGLRLAQKDDGGREKLTPELIARTRRASAGIDLFTVGPALGIISHEKLPTSADQSERDVMWAESGTMPVFFYEQRRSVSVYVKNYQIGELSFVSGLEAGRHAKFARPAREYEEMIREHYEECVKNGDHCDHWDRDCRRPRVLRRSLGRCKKTEEIFQESLLAWLSKQLTDAQALAEPRKPNKDRADILITGFGEGFYLIEIKWLGTNGKTSYDLKRLSKGIKQLGTYAIRSTLPEFTTLVAYDGRDEREFKKFPQEQLISAGVAKLESCNGVPVPAAGSCLVVFLISNAASESQ